MDRVKKYLESIRGEVRTVDRYPLQCELKQSDKEILECLIKVLNGQITLLSKDEEDTTPLYNSVIESYEKAKGILLKLKLNSENLDLGCLTRYALPEVVTLIGAQFSDIYDEVYPFRKDEFMQEDVLLECALGRAVEYYQSNPEVSFNQILEKEEENVNNIETLIDKHIIPNKHEVESIFETLRKTTRYTSQLYTVSLNTPTFTEKIEDGPLGALKDGMFPDELELKVQYLTQMRMYQGQLLEII